MKYFPALALLSRLLSYRFFLGVIACLACNSGLAQTQPITDDDATVSYPASYFEQYSPFSARDMLNRIPGINNALQDDSAVGSAGSSSPSTSSSDRRGLGLGGDQILINGRRITGKGNEGNSQLSRIPASEVDRIEIIRGTSGELDVRGGSQVINIVLLNDGSRSSVAYEISSARYQDNTVLPGGKISLTGQRGALDYLLSAELEPRWEHRLGFEISRNADLSLNDSVRRLNERDSSPVTISANIGYGFTPKDIAHLNIQFEDGDEPQDNLRTITNFNSTPFTVLDEQDIIADDTAFWEVGGDYEHSFSPRQRLKSLFIINQREVDNLRETFNITGGNFDRSLFLANFNRYQERIVRTSFSQGLGASQDIEIGLERAETTLDSTLRLGLNRGVNPNPDFGGLTPITDSDATVEELRYEGFAIHNWQLNPRMSLESTLIYETSEISQSGDVSRSRDFSFVRPKLDYRFDITPAIQLRTTVERVVAQLNFNDFTANTNSADDDQNAIAGNPDLRQEQSWQYEVNLEYRLPDDAGVLNSRVFYHDLEDVIDRLDVSTATTIQSANGNIGDGERYGVSLDASLRLGFVNLPNVLLTSRLELTDSQVTDPFLGIERRLNRQGRGNFQLGYRHDLPRYNANYGFDYRYSIQDNRLAFDIDRIESFNQGDFLLLFAEITGWQKLTYRFEASNLTEGERCRIRSRFIAGTIATGNLNEIEDSCSNTGIVYSLSVRGTF